MEGIKYVLTHFIEIAVAGVLLYIDIRYFLFFGFVFHLYSGFLRYNHLRASIRVFNMTTESKLIAIINKLGVKAEDINKVIEEHKTLPNWDSLRKDARLIGIGLN